MTPEPDDIAPLAVPVIDGQLGMLDDWMTEPTELEQRQAEAAAIAAHRKAAS